MPIGVRSKGPPMPTKKPTRKKEPPNFKPHLFGESGDEDLEDMALNLVGLPTGGKTFVALSIDPAWPTRDGAPLERQKKKVWLDRILHIGFDRSALVGLSQFNIGCRWRVNVPQIMGKRGWNIRSATEYILDEAAKMCEKYQLEATIVDTVTRFDRFLFAHWFDEENIPLTRDDVEDSQTAYGKIFRDHHMLQSCVMSLPTRPIFCFHLKALPLITQKKEEQRKAQKRKQKLIQGENGATLVPAVTGSASEVYFGDASIEFVCRSFKSPSTGKWTYEVRPNGYLEIRGKNRLRDALKDTEPANLRAIMQKVLKK